MSVDAKPFRVSFVDGVTVSKWARIWSERIPTVELELVRSDDADQVSVLQDGRADMGFVRLPIADDGLSVIPLYAETPFVVVAKDHPIALFDSVTLADLDAEDHLDGCDDDAFALAAAGAGVLVVPQSIARLRSRRDVVSRPVTDGQETRIGLVWRADVASERTEEFIGIVRGRTARSSRGSAPEPQAQESKRPAAKNPGVRRSPTARPGRSRGRPRHGKR